MVSHRRAKFQFTLKALMLAFGLIAVVLTWIVKPIVKINRQRIAVESLRSLQASVSFDPTSENNVPLWYRLFFGQDGYAAVIAVSYSPQCDSELEPLFDLEDLCELRLRRASFTKRGVLSLQNLRKLSILEVSDSRIEDSCFADSRVFTSLKCLDFRATSVGDLTLAWIGAHESLVKLSLSETSITDRGMPQLRSLRNLQELDIGYTQITDDGIAPIAELNRLETLWLCGNRITGNGLMVLTHLEKLAYIDADSCALTRECVKAIQLLWPKGNIHLRSQGAFTGDASR